MIGVLVGGKETQKHGECHGMMEEAEIGMLRTAGDPRCERHPTD